MQVLFLGTGAAEGVPAAYCRCDDCRGVRERGGIEIKSRSSLRIGDHHQVDVAPDHYWQMLRCDTDMFSVEHLLISHSHEDHFDLAGITDKEMSVETNDLPVTVYMSQPAADYAQNVLATFIKTSEQKAKIARHMVIEPLQYFQEYRIGELTVHTPQGNHTAWGEGERSINYLITDGIKPVYEFPAPDFENLPAKERRVGELITEHFIRDGITLQVGIGKIPDAVIGVIKESGCGNLGVQTELYGDGLMLLQQLGMITNRKKKINTGYSTTSLIMGSRALYDYVHMRNGVQMRPSSYTNASETVRKNSPFVSVNTAFGIDLFGNVWADFIDPRRYYSGVGGQPDFIRAVNHRNFGTAIIAIKSTTDKGRSKIVKRHPPGVSLTASAYDGIVVVTEYGLADLRGLSTGNKAVAIASIAHPDYRDKLLRYIVDNPFFTKPYGFSLSAPPYGVVMYGGPTPLAT